MWLMTALTKVREMDQSASDVFSLPLEPRLWEEQDVSGMDVVVEVLHVRHPFADCQQAAHDVDLLSEMVTASK